MKIKLLKQIRQQVANKYQVIHAKENDGSYKWRIQCGPQTYLAYCEWDEREKADEYMIYLWQKEAAEYLWNHRNKRNNKRKHYIW
jgi:hypothetical protein